MIQGHAVINRLFDDSGSAIGLTDGQLLGRFRDGQGAARQRAFEGLVARHGPMVSRACRAWLRDENDVEDAFQATFLVLVRRARSLDDRELLGPWLHAVARRVARKARATSSRRRGREGGSIPSGREPSSVDPARPFDVAPMVHEEVARLPEKYRRPVILCHLQGLTHAEAARELAWPVGTVSVRLSRARKLLEDRLGRRGVTAPAGFGVGVGGLLASGLSAEAAASAMAVPAALLAATSRLAASAGLSAPAGLSASAAPLTLARQTSAAMLLAPCKWLAVPAALAVAVGSGALLDRPKGGSPAAAGAPPVVAARPIDVDGDNAPDLYAGQPAPAGGKDDDRDTYEVGGGIGDLQATVDRFKRADPGATFRLKVSGSKIPFDPRVGMVPAGKPAEAAGNALDAPGIAGPAPGDAVEGFEPFGKPARADLPPMTRAEMAHLPPTPPGYFAIDNLPRQDGVEMRPIEVGQVVSIEVLEALPGRPITGERTVRHDGTVSLGFYGDLKVAGLTRDQAKVKMLERLRLFLTDDVLGLATFDEPTGERRFVAPVDSNRVFVEDQVGPVTRPDTGAEAEAEPDRTPVDPPLVRLPSGEVRLQPPAGYFDLPPADPTRPGAPRPVRVGQVIAVEMLEALPGRPLSGERVVRGDGTISLGFYGDLFVDGLDRDQIKVKVVERMRRYLEDAPLGLVASRSEGGRDRLVAVRPVDSDRVFVDDQPGPAPDRAAVEPSPRAEPPRAADPFREYFSGFAPKPTTAMPPAAAEPADADPARKIAELRAQVDDLSRKLDEVIRLAKVAGRPAVPADRPADPSTGRPIAPRLDDRFDPRPTPLNRLSRPTPR